MGLRQRGSVIGNYATASSNLATGIWTAKEAHTLQKKGTWKVAPSFSLASSAATINEGASATFTLTTTGIPNGTLIPYTVTGSNVNVLDFTSGNLTGNFVIVDGTGTASFSARNDRTTEDTETIEISTLGLTANVTINDTSTDPDPQFSFTTLLLKGNGTNNSQNNTFLDSSTNNFTLTRNGNPTQGTFTPYGSSWSNYFDGSSYYGYSGTPSTLSSLNFALNQDFTMEMWVYSTSSSSDYTLVNFGTYRQAYGSEFVVWITNKSASIFISGGSGTSYTEYKAFYPASLTLTLNTWNHIAVVRSSNNLTVYLNGVGGSPVSAPGAAQPGSDRYDLAGPHGFWFGVNATNWTAFSPTLFTGYMSNFRYVKGTALYTSTFTPPTAPLSLISNTEILTLNANRVLNAANVKLTPTIVAGSTNTQKFSPFGPSEEYSANTIGGSANFDGTGDYLVTPTSSALSLSANNSNFTMECWVYNNGYAGSQYGKGIFIYYPSGGSGASRLMFRLDYASNKINVYLLASSTAQFGGGGTNTTDSAVANAWTHLALVRNTGVFYVYINGTLDVTINSAFNASDIPFSTYNVVELGRTQDGTAPDFYGYISNYRFVKGTAVYTGNFTPPTAPLTASGSTSAASYSSTANVNITFPQANTALLCNFTNAGIIDNAMMNNLETTGDAKISTAQSKFGGTSMSFDGTGDYLSFSNRANRSLYFSTGNWTVEMWAYYNTTGTYDHALLGSPNQSFYHLIFGVYNYGTQLGFWNENTFYGMYNASNLTSGVWRHIAYVRNSNTITLYINGTSVATQAYSAATKDDAANDFLTGAVGPGFNGYIDDLRITKGFARYTANFTPPTKTFPAN